MRARRPLRRARRHRTHRRARRRAPDRRRHRRVDRPVPRVGRGVPAHPEGDGVGVGAGALVDRRPASVGGSTRSSSSTVSPPLPRPRSPARPSIVPLAVPALGADQVVAVRTLCGPGGAVRAVLAPAGYGKTAMAHVAAGCAAADGRVVVAVATTAKAVAELDAAGLPARTIAAFRLDLQQRAPAAGTVVILDEISQTSTRDAHTRSRRGRRLPGQSAVDPRRSAPGACGEGRWYRRRDRRPCSIRGRPGRRADGQPTPTRPDRPTRARHPAPWRPAHLAAGATRPRLGTHRRNTRGDTRGDGRCRRRRRRS